MNYYEVFCSVLFLFVKLFDHAEVSIGFEFDANLIVEIFSIGYKGDLTFYRKSKRLQRILPVPFFSQENNGLFERF